MASVAYPDLDSFLQLELATTQMDDFGGMIAFELVGGYDAGCKMMNRLNLVSRAISMGDAETLIQHPPAGPMRHIAPGSAALVSIEGLVRSVGVEDTTDILDDIRQAPTVA